MTLRRHVPRLAAVLLALSAPFFALPAATALAGNPHFVSATATTSGDTLTVAAKEAGLGAESSVHVVLTATAQCVNGGGNKPSAGNKASFSSAGDFPVTNGQSTYSISVTAAFQPPCSPPMTVAWSDITLADEANGISLRL